MFTRTALVLLLLPTVVLCGSAALTTTAVSSPSTPPMLPTFFEGDFLEYTATSAYPPPYVDGIPQPPYYASRGKVHYDWTRKAMIEERLDHCVNIFSFPNTFPCTFFNVMGTSYLLSSGTSNLPPCCLFGQPWYPPPPNFLQNNTGTFVRQEQWGCGSEGVAEWWTDLSIPPPTGPFFFSYNKSSNSTTTIPPPPQVYKSFSFPGMEGWVQQVFKNIKPTQPDPSTWDLPSECKVSPLPNCNFFDKNLDNIDRVGQFHRRV